MNMTVPSNLKIKATVNGVSIATAGTMSQPPEIKLPSVTVSKEKPKPA